MTDRYIPLPNDYNIKKTIAHAIDRSIDDMSVSGICDKVGISRQLFYRNFESKYDIANWHMKSCIQASLKRIGRSMGWDEGFEAYFEFIAVEKEMYLHFLKSKYYNDYLTQIRDYINEIFCRTVYQIKGLPETLEMSNCIMMFSSGVVFMTKRWFRMDFEPESTTYARMMVECVPRRFYAALQQVEKLDQPHVLPYIEPDFDIITPPPLPHTHTERERESTEPR